MRCTQYELEIVGLQKSVWKRQIQVDAVILQHVLYEFGHQATILVKPSWIHSFCRLNMGCSMVEDGFQPNPVHSKRRIFMITFEYGKKLRPVPARANIADTHIPHDAEEECYITKLKSNQ
jgi:hypothetical protein